MGPRVRVAKLLLAAAVLPVVVFGQTLHLRKCCGADQMLDPQLDNCIPRRPARQQLTREERENEWWWLPPDIVADLAALKAKNDSSIKDVSNMISVEINAPQPCHVDLSRIYPWGKHVANGPKFHKDGSITVQQTGADRLDRDAADAKITRNYTFSPSSFCVDVVFNGEDEAEPSTTILSIEVSTLGNSAQPSRNIRSTHKLDLYYYLVLLCPCMGEVHCVHICCPPGRVLQSSGKQTKCVKSIGTNYTNIIEGRKYIREEKGSNLFTVYSLPQCENPDDRRYLLDQTKKSEEVRSSHVYVQSDGTAQVDKFGYGAFLDAGQFCSVTTIDRKTNYTRPNVLVCNNITKRAHFGFLAIFGAIFLGATILVYVCLPELRTRGLHSRNLIAHTGSLLLMYICLAIYYVSGNRLSQVPCRVLGFTMQFSFLASMFWLNVMCFDISWAFSGWKLPQGSAADRDRRVFIWYSIYAWGGAGIITLTTVVMDLVLPDDSLMIRPRMAEIECWFKDTSGILLYYYGPVGVLLLINVILFVYTAGCIFNVRRDTAILRKPDTPRRNNSARARADARDRASSIDNGCDEFSSATSDSDFLGRIAVSPTQYVRKFTVSRFFLYVKLFALMGVLWGTEVISWAAGGPKYYWYFTDAINLLRAVFIFIMICWKRKVGRLLACKLEGLLPMWCIPWEKGYFDTDAIGACARDLNGTRTVTRTRTSSLQMGSSSTINHPQAAFKGLSAVAQDNTDQGGVSLERPPINRKVSTAVPVQETITE